MEEDIKKGVPGQTLILASNTDAVTKYLPLVIEKPRAEVSVVCVITGGNVKDDKDYLVRGKKSLQHAGYRYTEYDIAGKSEDELRQDLVPHDVVFVQGGDTFYLMRQILESGFERVIRDMLAKGKIYVGASAGSYVASASFDIVAWRHPDDDHYGLEDYQGMGLVPVTLLAHYAPEMDEFVASIADKVEQELWCLKDGMALLVRDDDIKLLK